MPPDNWSFLVDENMSRSLVASLQAAGYKAAHVVDAGLRGRPDADVYAHAQTHRQTIITGDLGFANIIGFPPPHAGMIVARLPETAPLSDRLQEVMNALRALAGQSLENTLVIVEQGRIRVRR